MSVMKIKKTVLRLLPYDSDIRWIISCVYHNPCKFLFILIKSMITTKTLTGNFFPIVVRLSNKQTLIVKKSKSSVIEIKGRLHVESWGGLNTPSTISISPGATFQILGDYIIGPGVHLSVAKNGTLKLGGKVNSTGSGITCNTRIVAEKYIEIGVDTIIAWDVFITDSDWHDIKGSQKIMPVFIGEHVWISHGVSILKGSRIPSGCIVAAKSLVGKGLFEEGSLIAGVPARVCKRNIQWSR